MRASYLFRVSDLVLVHLLEKIAKIALVLVLKSAGVVCIDLQLSVAGANFDATHFTGARQVFGLLIRFGRVGEVLR